MKKTILAVFLFGTNSYADDRAPIGCEREYMIYTLKSRNPKLPAEVKAKLADDLNNCAASVAQKESDDKATVYITAAKEQEAAEKQDQERRAFYADGRNSRMAINYLYCQEEQNYKDAIKSIREERKNAVIGGVVNIQYIYEYQQDAADAKEGMAKYKKMLISYKVKFIPCADSRIQDYNSDGLFETELQKHYRGDNN